MQYITISIFIALTVMVYLLQGIRNEVLDLEKSHKALISSIEHLVDSEAMDDKI